MMKYPLALLSILFAFQFPIIAEAEPLRVGVIIPLTGFMAGNARFGKDGVELALKSRKVAEALQVQYEDYGSEPARVIASYKKLADLNGVKVFLVFGTPAAMALNSMIEHDKNVQLAVASAEKLTKEGGFAFRLINSASVESEYIAKQFGLLDQPERTAIVHVEDDYGESYLRGVEAALGPEKSAKLSISSFPSKENDFRTIILQLRTKRPETVFLAAFAPPIGMFLRQARELNLRSKFVCTVACYNPDLFKLAQGAEEGIEITSPSLPEDPQLIEEYRSQFHEEPNFIALGFYDAMNMLSEIAEKCSTASEVGVCLRDSLRRPEGFKTSRGRLKYDAKGEIPFKLMTYAARNGQFVPQ